MDDQVLLADRRVAITGVVANALREAWIIRHELEIGPIDMHELRQLGERQHTVDMEDFVVSHGQCVLYETPQLARHRSLEL